MSNYFMPRLDTMLVDRGLAPTRSRALDLIRRGFVAADGRIVTKGGAEVSNGAAISLAPDAPRYVSRGAEKLIAALESFNFDPSGLEAVDIGASTGGFTEVLLARGAARVTAVDVGRDQLAVKLRSDPRVRVLEGTDARALNLALFPSRPQSVVADVSFISLTKALPASLELAASGAWATLLVKPQFEVGPDFVGKGGIVRDMAAREKAVERIVAWLKSLGWIVEGSIPSPITGGDGNQEFLIGAWKRDTDPHA